MAAGWPVPFHGTVAGTSTKLGMAEKFAPLTSAVLPINYRLFLELVATVFTKTARSCAATESPPTMKLGLPAAPIPASTPVPAHFLQPPCCGRRFAEHAAAPAARAGFHRLRPRAEGCSGSFRHARGAETVFFLPPGGGGDVFHLRSQAQIPIMQPSRHGCEKAKCIATTETTYCEFSGFRRANWPSGRKPGWWRSAKPIPSSICCR